jgi:hypothetical protein
MAISDIPLDLIAYYHRPNNVYEMRMICSVVSKFTNVTHLLDYTFTFMQKLGLRIVILDVRTSEVKRNKLHLCSALKFVVDLNTSICFTCTW